MKARLLATTAIALMWAGAAAAADLPSAKGPPPAPVVYVPAFTWTGFYVGANVGYAWNNSDLSYGYGAYDWWDNYYFTSYFPYSADVGKDGWTGGVQAGYNYQFGSFVVGVEADINYVDGQKDWNYYWTGQDGYLSGENSYLVGAQASGGLEWLGTVRARLGFAADRFLVYVTGGLAFGETSSSAGVYVASDYFATTLPSGGVGVPGYSDYYYLASWYGSQSDTKFGWTVGAGVEYAFTNNWTVKLEYLYYDLGDDTYTLIGRNYDGWRFDSSFAPVIKKETTGSLARIGINYKF